MNVNKRLCQHGNLIYSADTVAVSDRDDDTDRDNDKPTKHTIHLPTPPRILAGRRAFQVRRQRSEERRRVPTGAGAQAGLGSAVLMSLPSTTSPPRPVHSKAARRQVGKTMVHVRPREQHYHTVQGSNAALKGAKISRHRHRHRHQPQPRAPPLPAFMNAQIHDRSTTDPACSTERSAASCPR